MITPIKYFSIAFISTVFLSSCVSTDIINPASTENASSQITLRMDAPEKINTRADAGYKLRYIAKIYEGDNRKVWDKPVQRQELIDGENDNQMIFKVNPNQDYAILVFADYIPESFQPDADGLYKDYFYNTTINNSKRCTLRMTPGSNDYTTPSTEFFNNHNYDAFFCMETFYKEDAEKIVNMTLKRTTAQVIVRESSETRGDFEVKVNKIGARMNFDQDQKSSTDPDFYEANKDRKDLLLGTSSIDEENQDVFFFYTLADPTTAPQNVSTEFTITKEQKTSETITVKDIPVKANYKTIVKGVFLPADAPSDEPGDDDDENKGDVILNLTTDFDWEQEPISK